MRPIPIEEFNNMDRDYQFVVVNLCIGINVLLLLLLVLWTVGICFTKRILTVRDTDEEFYKRV